MRHTAFSKLTSDPPHPTHVARPRSECRELERGAKREPSIIFIDCSHERPELPLISDRRSMFEVWLEQHPTQREGRIRRRPHGQNSKTEHGADDPAQAACCFPPTIFFDTF